MPQSQGLRKLKFANAMNQPAKTAFLKGFGSVQMRGISNRVEIGEK
jgi:hypothetical protein